MKKPRLSRQARADLRGIVTRLNRRNRANARRTYDEIMARIWSHAQQPLTGSPCDDFLPELRSSAVASYVVFFRPVADTIEVLRVLWGTRDHKKIIQQETEI